MKRLKNLMLTMTLLFSSIFSVVLSRDVFAEGDTPRTGGEQRITADDLTWTPVSEENPLGGADDFSAIFFDKFANFNETGAAVAARKFEDVDIVTFNEGLTGGINKFGDYTIPHYNVGIIAQDKIEGSKAIRVQNGDAILGDSVNQEMIDKAHPDIIDEGSIFTNQQAQIDKFMADAKADTQQLNKDLWKQSANQEISVEGTTVTLDATQDINIFDLDTSIDGLQLNIDYEEDKSDSTIILKVSGNKLDLSDTYVNKKNIGSENIDSITNRILWVFDPEVTNIEVNESEIMGSVIAPHANFTLKGGYSAINGTMIANSLVAVGDKARGSEFHYTGLFKGMLPRKTEEVTTGFSVEKRWKNESSEEIDAPEGVEVTVQLYKEKNGEDIKVESQEVTLSSSNNWKESFTDLPALDDAGDDIKYNVKEVENEDTKGYTAKVTGSMSAGFIITNTKDSEEPPELETTEISVEKQWIDEKGNEITDPDEKITIHLFKDNESEAVETVELDGSENWTHTFDNLATKNEDGTTIEYTVEEEAVDGYESDVSEIDENNKIIITNIKDTPLTPIEPGKTWVDVEKVWKDQDGEVIEDTSDLDGITVHLIADGDADNPVATVELNKDNNWTHTFSDLDAQTDDLEKITYSVKEDKISGYESKVSEIDENNKIIVTNTEDTPLTPIEPGTTSVDVEKEWIGKVGDSVIINLLADGKKIDSIELSKDNNWKHTFEDLPVVNDITDEKAIKYTVEEIELDGYTISINGNAEDGFIITNTEQTDPEEPTEPTDPDKPGTPDQDDPKDEDTPESEDTDEEDKLPQTGEQDDTFLTVLGLLLIILPSIYLYNGRETNFK